MNYETFLGAVERGLSERFSDDIAVTLHRTVKNNGLEKQGITITKKNVNISPTIYLEEFYKQYQNGRSIEEIVKKIDRVYHEVRYEESFDVQTIQKYENLKDKILFKLINREKNKKLLETVPYIEYQDLVLVFYVLLDVRKGGSATILITESMRKMWGVNLDELYETAQRNGRRLMPATLLPIGEVIKELFAEYSEVEESVEEVTGEMYVLTNEIRNLGAAVIAYDHVLEMIAEKLQTSFYVLPSSIHEVILVCNGENIRREELDKTIQEVNQTQVEQEEILGNHAYYYDRVSKALYF